MNIQIRGVKYHFEWHNSKQTFPNIVFLHGFLGSGDSFKEVVNGCKNFCNPITVDLLGHGQSEGAELHYRFSTKEQMLDIVKLIQEQLSSPVFLYGYSMGARLALNIAVQRPDLIQGLILESGTFGIESETERQARQALDGTRADEILGNYHHFLDTWHKMDLFKHDRLDEQLYNIQKNQNPCWMANALLGFGTGTMPCLRNNLKKIIAPTLLFTGEFDSKFIQINQVIAKELPHAELLILKKCGHRVHANAPKEIIHHLKFFIETHPL